MPAIARIGDKISCGDTIGEGSSNVFANGIPVMREVIDQTTGHGCWPPTFVIPGSPNVFINNRKVVRVGDPIVPHTCPTIPETHGGVVSSGSPNVFVNN